MLDSEDRQSTPSLWVVLVSAAAAGAMGWGIRGQYGHETGAMMAGVFVGLVMVHFFCPGALSLTAARAVALCAIGVSLGGMETYGQTVGLTHDPTIVGNWSALWWGLLGLGIKGGLWIGFAGAMLGMGLSDRTYRPLEMLVLLAVMMAAMLLGIWLLNMPFDPGARELPKLYFSDDWYWEPGAELEPRRERWGGLLAALVVLVGYVGVVRKDRLAMRLAGWGVLGGFIGFPGGQCLQAYHAWSVDSFREGWFAPLDRHMNWWNVMEMTFGAVWAMAIGLGVWLNRKLIAAESKEATYEFGRGIEWLLVIIHTVTLALWNFVSIPQLDAVADYALPMIMIPLIAVIGGRVWPYLVTLPIVALPIAGKTLRYVHYEQNAIGLVAGWAVYLIIPLLFATVVALLLAKHWDRGPSALVFSRWALLVATWLYFGLNFAFFDYPWPWESWTYRTPGGIAYVVYAVVLTLTALFAVPKFDSGAPNREVA